MKRGNIHKAVFALFALLLAAACDKEEFADTPAPDPGAQQQIRFDVTVATGMPSDASTRVATNANFTSAFTSGDKVGLFIVKGDGAALQSSGNWVDNAPMTFDGSAWTCTLPAGKDVYPKDGEPLSFYAYFPYRPEGVDPLEMSFTVQTDQSTAADFAKSHLLMAVKTGVGKSNNPVQLVFSHKMAMLKVNLKDGANDWEKVPRPADVVTLVLRYPQTTLNLATGATTIGAEQTRTGIKMYRNPADGCWYALLAPGQRIGNGNHLIDFEWTHITSLKHTHRSDPYLLEAGQVKPLDITISIDEYPNVDPNHVYQVGDAYPHVGFTRKRGVVFEVSNGGKSGKIVGLRRMEGVLVWSTELVFTNISDEDNGRVNMEGFRKLDGKFDKYPAMKWVHSLNRQETTYGAQSTGVWYLPAQNEMKAVCSEQNREILTPVLKELGIENPFPEYKYAWTSTDWTNINVATVHLENGLGMAQGKDDAVTNCTWPIMAF